MPAWALIVMQCVFSSFGWQLRADLSAADEPGRGQSSAEDLKPLVCRFGGGGLVV